MLTCMNSRSVVFATVMPTTWRSGKGTPASFQKTTCYCATSRASRGQSSRTPMTWATTGNTRSCSRSMSRFDRPQVASCIEGARARPPEDVGGTSGYQEFLEALSDPQHENHVHMTRWCGGHFDPAWFDLDLIN